MSKLQAAKLHLPQRVAKVLKEHGISSKGASATVDTAGLSVGVWMPDGYLLKPMPKNRLFESSQVTRQLGHPELCFEGVLEDIFALHESLYRVNLIDALGQMRTVRRGQIAEVTGK